jgi:hypothetical protein
MRPVTAAGAAWCERGRFMDSTQNLMPDLICCPECSALAPSCGHRRRGRRRSPGAPPPPRPATRWCRQWTVPSWSVLFVCSADDGWALSAEGQAVVDVARDTRPALAATVAVRGWSPVEGSAQSGTGRHPRGRTGRPAPTLRRTRVDETRSRCSTDARPRSGRAGATCRRRTGRRSPSSGRGEPSRRPRAGPAAMWPASRDQICARPPSTKNSMPLT